ncbi:MAG TPA: DUF4956 domain-containing protein [Anaerolineae bacterium]|jgi:uncharacterized membrane protein YhiD involved in acid resistance
MDFTSLFSNLQQTTDVFSAADIIFTVILSFILSLMIAWVYKITYKGVSYTQSYVHTLIMMAMVVAVIMLVIGSNIARAFSLVGALSIIRFRNAVKDTRDVGYIFFAMAIGMASGTRFYLVAIIATLLISFILWGMGTLNLFAKDVKEQILKIRLPADMRYETLFQNVFARYLANYNLIAVETVQAGTQTELIYGIELKKQGDAQSLMEALRQINDNNKVSLVTGYHEIDL